MKVLVGCEFSGKVRDAFAHKGHEAWSCDYLPAEGKHQHKHIQSNVLDLLNQNWDLLICFPPCTFLSSSGLHWNGRVEGRQAKTDAALQFVRTLLTADIPMIALENPVGCISTKIKKPDQIIQPYDFGDNASKRTCLWLKNLPNLTPTEYFPPRISNGKERWGNQTDSGQNKLAPSPTRAKKRSITYDGIANAMADQWGQNI